MKPFYDEFETIIDSDDLPPDTFEEICGILSRKSTGIAPYRGLRLFKLLNYLKKEGFFDLNGPEKKDLLQNLIDLLAGQKAMMVIDVCHLFFVQVSANKEKQHLPEEMIRRLITSVKRERLETVRTKIWQILLREGTQSARFLSLENLTNAIWLDDPLMRNNVIGFMFRYHNPQEVLDAICDSAINSGRSISKEVCNRLIEFAQVETKLKFQKGLLPENIRNETITHAEMERIWGGYLNRRHRFELIEIFMSERTKMKDIDGLKERNTVLCSRVEFDESRSSNAENVNSRFDAIRARITGN